MGWRYASGRHLPRRPRPIRHLSPVRRTTRSQRDDHAEAQAGGFWSAHRTAGLAAFKHVHDRSWATFQRHIELATTKLRLAAGAGPSRYSDGYDSAGNAETRSINLRGAIHAGRPRHRSGNHAVALEVRLGRDRFRYAGCFPKTMAPAARLRLSACLIKVRPCP